jgi:hypothetical protein
MAVPWWRCSTAWSWAKAPSKILRTNLKNPLTDYLRGELSHAGSKTVNREAELPTPTGVGSGDLLACFFMVIA